MLFTWIGFLKPGAEITQEVQRQTSDFIAQPYIKVHAVGPLLDAAGKRAAMMMLFEVPDRAAGEAFVANSPYLQAGLYELHELYEYHSEVGGL